MKTLCYLFAVILFCCVSPISADEKSDAEAAREQAFTSSNYAYNEHDLVPSTLESVQALRSQVITAINNAPVPQRDNLSGQLFDLQPGAVFQSVRDSYYGTTIPFVKGTVDELDEANTLMASGDTKAAEPNYPGAQSDYEAAQAKYNVVVGRNCADLTTLDALRNNLENILSQCAGA